VPLVYAWSASARKCPIIVVLWRVGRYLDALIEAEAAAGIPSTRVVVAGFSQVSAPALSHPRLLATLFVGVLGRHVATSCCARTLRSVAHVLSTPNRHCESARAQRACLEHFCYELTPTSCRCANLYEACQACGLRVGHFW